MFNRRQFLATGSLAVAGGVLASTAQVKTAKTDLSTWAAVRAQFDQLDPSWIHLGLFYIASHPRPVREAIENYRRRIDHEPFNTVEHLMFGNDNVQDATCNRIARYIGGNGGDIALTQNTTTGLALLYNGLSLKPGDEILLTTHDHYVHHEAVRLAAERSGATWRRIPLFDSYDAVDVDGMMDRIRAGIRPNTKVLGVTWVHSSSGVRLPLRRIAETVAEVNAKRDADRRVLLFVDAVHGFGVEDPKLVATGIDAFSAGTHKWIFGPRGTGFVWARPDVWAQLRPTIPTFHGMDLFGYWAEGVPPQSPARAAWFSPGGFQAMEHHWALPAAFDFHDSIGSKRITGRIHELNSQFKEGVARMPHVVLYTPRAGDLSAGIVCFDVKGMKQTEVVQRLLQKRVIASTTPYRDSYARVAFGIVNTPEEVEKTLAAVRTLA